MTGVACAPSHCPNGHPWKLHSPKEKDGLPYFFCTRSEGGTKCLQKAFGPQQCTVSSVMSAIKFNWKLEVSVVE